MYLVVAFTVASTVDEAIELANDSEYSLVAALWTSDRFAALDLAPRIRAGEWNAYTIRDSILSRQVTSTLTDLPFILSLIPV
jgi:acyl-CoA reductase-like NAD-dependent aldehyde dehydrogenase